MSGQARFANQRSSIMNTDLVKAIEAIQTYTYGMDTNDWGLAASVLADNTYIDYAAVGGPRGEMTRQEIAQFLSTLLGKADLKVHTAIAQVFNNPQQAGEYIAYYSVRHYRGQLGAAAKFAVFGWYRYSLKAGKVATLSVHVSAMEGDSTVLA
jgi:SnoaL-like domain